MEVNKKLPNIKIPFSFMHKLLTKQGFKKTDKLDETIYQAKLQDTTTQREYSLNIPTKQYEEQDEVQLGQAYIENEEDMPSSVIQAASSKLTEIADYMKQKQAESENTDKSLDEVQNGEMTEDFEDMKQLGKEMEQMRTEKQLNKKGKLTDPGQ
jgi:hypothetical protein